MSAKERPVSATTTTVAPRPHEHAHELTNATAKTVPPRALAHQAQGEAGKGSESARRAGDGVGGAGFLEGGGHGSKLAGVARGYRPQVYTPVIVGLFSFILGHVSFIIGHCWRGGVMERTVQMGNFLRYASNSRSLSLHNRSLLRLYYVSFDTCPVVLSNNRSLLTVTLVLF